MVNDFFNWCVWVLEVIGALIIAIIQFGIVFIDIKPFWQFVVVGVVIIVAVVVDQSKNKLSGVRTDE